MILNYDIYLGTFIERPNRFIAKVLVNEVIVTVHVLKLEQASGVEILAYKCSINLKESLVIEKVDVVL